MTTTDRATPAASALADIVEQAYADAPHMTYGHGAKQAARTIATILWRL